MSKAETFVSDCTRNCSNEFEPQKAPPSVYNPWLTPDDARKAVEIAREEIYEWLRVNLCDYFDAPREDYDMCINDLKQAMKEK